jgi:hypothetical protein
MAMEAMEAMGQALRSLEDQPWDKRLKPCDKQKLRYVYI